MISKGCGRKWSWPISGLGICVKGQRRIMSIWVWVGLADVPLRISVFCVSSETLTINPRDRQEITDSKVAFVRWTVKKRRINSRNGWNVLNDAEKLVYQMQFSDGLRNKSTIFSIWKSTASRLTVYRNTNADNTKLPAHSDSEGLHKITRQ